jgi:hypothetical protein
MSARSPEFVCSCSASLRSSCSMRCSISRSKVQGVVCGVSVLVLAEVSYLCQLTGFLAPRPKGEYLVLMIEICSCGVAERLLVTRSRC